MTPRGAHVLMHYWRADNCTTPGCALVGNHAFASEFPRPGSGGALFPKHADTEFMLTPSRGEAAGVRHFPAQFPPFLTGLSWICVGIHSRRALPCPVCALNGPIWC